MRMRNKPWAIDYLNQHSEIVVTEVDDLQQDVWQQFIRSNDIKHIEVGSGMGRFITTLAKQNPDIQYISVELDKNVMVRVLDKVLEQNLDNIRLICLPIEEIHDYLAINPLDQLYLNFSDPWPKNRHEKRRLTHHNYLSIYEKFLKDDALIQFKTDNRMLFEYSLISMSQYGYQFVDINLHVHDREPNDNIRTEYEEKFSSKGSRIYMLKAKLNE